MYAENIVEITKGYLARNIVEIQVNNGWTDSAFESEMKQYTPWQSGDEWCADSGMLIWKKGYADNEIILAIIIKLLSANSLQTAYNFHADKIWPTSVNIPKIGAIVVWAAGNSRTKGHFGIVIWVSADGKTFISGEGNTSSPTQPDNRSGWTFAQHTHTIDLPHSSLGLNIERFIYAIESYSPLTY